MSFHILAVFNKLRLQFASEHLSESSQRSGSHTSTSEAILKVVVKIETKFSSIVKYYQPSFVAEFYVITYCYFEDVKLLHSKFMGQQFFVVSWKNGRKQAKRQTKYFDCHFMCLQNNLYEMMHFYGIYDFKVFFFIVHVLVPRDITTCLTSPQSFFLFAYFTFSLSSSIFQQHFLLLSPFCHSELPNIN